MELKQKQVLITIWILGNPECLRSVADRFNITKSILFRVYRRICGAIANKLSGQYLKYLLVWNWAPLGKMINFGSFAQRNALDQWSNDPSLDHADQWSDESLSRVDLIDHWSENGFARKDNHRSEILIRILPKERTHTFYILATNSKIIKKLIFTLYIFFRKLWSVWVRASDVFITLQGNKPLKLSATVLAQ